MFVSNELMPKEFIISKSVFCFYSSVNILSMAGGYQITIGYNGMEDGV